MVKESIMGERLMKIETTLDYVKKTLDDNKVEHEAILRKLDALDSRYASKLTEKIVYALIGLITVAVITAIIKLVILG